jgi:hypothetical protein
MNKHQFRVINHLIIVLIVSCASRPSIAGTIFSDGFESGNSSHTQSNAHWYGSTRTDVTNAISHSGKYSLRFTYPGNPDPAKDSWAEQRFDLGAFYPEVYIQFYIYYPDGREGVGPQYIRRKNATGALNDKFLRLFGAADRTGAKEYITVAGGASTWSNSNLDGARIGLENSCTYNGAKVDGMGKNGNGDFPFIADSSASPNDNRGRWIKIKYHRKVASPANNDGVEQLWIDDVLTESVTNLCGYPGDGYTNAWSSGYLLGWSNTGFDKDTYIYIDDVVFSTTNDFNTIETSIPTAAPSPPSDIK